MKRRSDRDVINDSKTERNEDVKSKNSRRIDDDGRNDCCRPIALLHDKYYRTVPLVDVYVDTIVDIKYASRLIDVLKTALPVPSLLHLKRINGNRVILTLVDDLSIIDCRNLIERIASENDDSSSTTTYLSSRPTSVKVPAVAPLTSAQFKQASVYWPCLFREEKTVERLLSGDYFDDGQTIVIRRNMETAVLTACLNRSSVGALAYDPARDRVLAVSIDRTYEHPFKHAVTSLIDTIARRQGGGRWSSSVTKTTGLYREEISGDNERSDFLLTNNIDNNIDDSKKTNTVYLLTGYDVYVTREPCITCSMALTHSRVRCLFYGCPRPENGGLGSLCKIHALPQLNHRYLVFPNVLIDRCRQLTTYSADLNDAFNDN